jgi:hypothetical protein
METQHGIKLIFRKNKNGLKCLYKSDCMKSYILHNFSPTWTHLIPTMKEAVLAIVNNYQVICLCVRDNYKYYIHI